MARARADQLAAEQGLAETRELAARLIMAGRVFLEDEDGRRTRVDKPGQQLKPDALLVLEGGKRFVSRGGHKLLTAMEHFGLTVAGLVCLDAGASTGGFTDCLLQHGAARVYAVDVGKAQLHEKLLADPRVVSMEGVNLRLAPPDLLPEPVDLITADLSFISLTKVLPALLPLLAPSGRIVALIKPQFELPPAMVGHKGVVREESARRQAVDEVTAFCRDELGLAVHGVVPSSIKGPQGNQEYLVLLQKPA
ncbi:hemolysin A [Desulfovibrio sp. X2]|uniref:TlyA family RNA methyltransferase n=1 Tax=Desulfovibrio sp. X2 TaxID=941449 RepID=UPI000358C99E|nr:TlyA family RNA methyltransferase [Desulfovibrio sp. X2]EPR37430.1 hemolysin A [Desulfovibrio sp. X2]